MDFSSTTVPKFLCLSQKLLLIHFVFLQYSIKIHHKSIALSAQTLISVKSHLMHDRSCPFEKCCTFIGFVSRSLSIDVTSCSYQLSSLFSLFHYIQIPTQWTSVKLSQVDVEAVPRPLGSTVLSLLELCTAMKQLSCIALRTYLYFCSLSSSCYTNDPSILIHVIRPIGMPRYQIWKGNFFRIL